MVLKISKMQETCVPGLRRADTEGASQTEGKIYAFPHSRKKTTPPAGPLLTTQVDRDWSTGRLLAGEKGRGLEKKAGLQNPLTKWKMKGGRGVER